MFQRPTSFDLRLKTCRQDLCNATYMHCTMYIHMHECIYSIYGEGSGMRTPNVRMYVYMCAPQTRACMYICAHPKRAHVCIYVRTPNEICGTTYEAYAHQIYCKTSQQHPSNPLPNILAGYTPVIYYVYRLYT